MLGKLVRVSRANLKLCMIAILLPSLIRSRKKLRSNFWPTLKKAIIKTLTATLATTLAASMPWPVYCLLSRYIRLTGFTSSLAIFCGAVWLSIEPASRQVQYVGYFLPKAIEIVTTILENRRLIKKRNKYDSTAILILATGLIGLATSRSHFSRVE